MLIKNVLLGRPFIEAKIDGGLFVISFHLILARHITTVYDLSYCSTCHYDANDTSKCHRSKAN